MKGCAMNDGTKHSCHTPSAWLYNQALHLTFQVSQEIPYCTAPGVVTSSPIKTFSQMILSLHTFDFYNK
jgi:hypothetical protein